MKLRIENLKSDSHASVLSKLLPKLFLFCNLVKFEQILLILIFWDYCSVLLSQNKYARQTLQIHFDFLVSRFEVNLLEVFPFLNYITYKTILTYFNVFFSRCVWMAAKSGNQATGTNVMYLPSHSFSLDLVCVWVVYW